MRIDPLISLVSRTGFREDRACQLRYRQMSGIYLRDTVAKKHVCTSEIHQCLVTK